MEGWGGQATPLYNLFVEDARGINTKYISIIMPARWYVGGFGLDTFRNEMLHDLHIRELYDFYDSYDCFKTLGHNAIKGGICCFLWDKSYNGKCRVINTSVSNRYLYEKGVDIFIRHNEAIPIIEKVLSYNEQSFSNIVSQQCPFGLPTNFNKHTDNPNDILLYGNKFISHVNEKHITKNRGWINKWKIFIPKCIGSGTVKDKIKYILAKPNSVCTETYIVVGVFDTEEKAKNVVSYMNTKFFHFFFVMRKITQDALADTYKFIPMQDFSKSWTDKELYEKYKFMQEEITYIEKLSK